MYKIESTRQFRTDFKALSKSDEQKVLKALKILEEDGTLPRIPYLTHQLKGEYANNWEAHIRPDLLLIWFEKEDDIIKLIRVGKHSNLFRKY